MADLLSDLVTDPGIDATLTGFGGAEIEHLTTGLDALQGLDLDDQSDAEASDPPVTRPGDLVVLGRDGEHRLACGDVTDPSAVAALMGDVRASVCHTDPPYGVRYDPRNRPSPRGRQRQRRKSSGAGAEAVEAKSSKPRGSSACPIRNDDLTPKQYARWFPRVADAIAEALIPGGAFYLWNAHRNFGLMHDVLTQRQLKVSSTIVWAKESFSPGFGDYQEQVEFCMYGFKAGARHRWHGPRNASTLWSVQRARQYNHPTQKPLELAERAVRNSSRRGEVVFDPFLGSGTTLLAAQLLGRRCYGMEIDPRHCDTAVRRFIAMAGASAVSPEVAERYRVVEKEVV
ncbi:MAG: site-specific DNA-methyltransferase [Planctomycetota bacterium]